MNEPELMTEVEIRQEARFVLWALRWCALARQGDEPLAQDEVSRGFDMAQAREVAVSFWEFADCLCRCVSSGLVWHGPACTCVSSGEMNVLHALAQVAGDLRSGAPAPALWWRGIVPASRLPLVDGLARLWLGQLQRAGIDFPGPTQLIEAMTPLHNLVEEGPARHRQIN
jgi:hypothetical protein